MSKVKIAIVIILLALIVVVATSPSKEKYVALVEEDNAVLVTDQQPGDEVTVNYVKLDKPGYVSVYSKSQDGAQELLGTSALLSAGEHRNVSVPLNKTVVSGNTVRIAAVADNGDGEFDEETDVAVLDQNNEEVSFEIDITPDAPIAEEVDLIDLADDAGYSVNEDSDLVNTEEASMEESMEEEESLDEDIIDSESTGEEVIESSTAEESIEADTGGVSEESSSQEAEEIPVDGMSAGEDTQ